MTSLEIANTILGQMGGAGQVARMLGVSRFIATGDGVAFSFKGSRACNRCKITLTPADLYRVEIFKISGANFKLTASRDEVFCDQLTSTFEELTGLIPCLIAPTFGGR